MEHWESKADDGLILCSVACHLYKNRSHSAIPIIPTFQCSIIPRHMIMAQPNFSDLAQLPARRAYSPEGGPGFGYPQRGFALLEVPWMIEITNNKQWPMTEIRNSKRSLVSEGFGYWNIGIWDLFEIWCLIFVILYTKHQRRANHLWPGPEGQGFPVWQK